MNFTVQNASHALFVNNSFLTPKAAVRPPQYADAGPIAPGPSLSSGRSAKPRFRRRGAFVRQPPRKLPREEWGRAV